MRIENLRTLAIREAKIRGDILKIGASTACLCAAESDVLQETGGMRINTQLEELETGAQTLICSNGRNMAVPPNHSPFLHC